MEALRIKLSIIQSISGPKKSTTFRAEAFKLLHLVAFVAHECISANSSISTPTPILAWLQIHRCSPTTRTVVDHTYLSHSTMTLIAVLVLLVVAKVFSTAPKLPYMFTARPTACKQKRTYASAYSTICVIDFRGHHGPGVCII